MAQGIHVDMTGNLTADPELRFTNSGVPVVNLRVACTRRFLNRQTNEWEPKETTYLSVEVWRKQGENVVESLRQGLAVRVAGTLIQKDYTTPQGEKRSTYVVVDAEVSIPLDHQTAQVTKTSGPKASGGSQGAVQAPAQQQAPQQNTYTPPPSPRSGSVLDQPPF